MTSAMAIWAAMDIPTSPRRISIASQPAVLG
jgi:hypothetical protein